MIKRAFCVLFSVMLLTGIMACEGDASLPEPEPVPSPVYVPSPAPMMEPELESESDSKEKLSGKIAIVTNTVDGGDEEYRSAEHIQEKYGKDYVIHRTWPVNFSAEGEMMIQILQEIADDPDVKVLIINQAVMNTNAAVRRFRERRDDVFIVYCSPAEREYYLSEWTRSG
jgi:hypothetical protein